MADGSEPYKYDLLPNTRSIRLAIRKTDIDSDNWACTFEVADIDKPPEYVALSYCWGDAEDRVLVRCDDGTVMVPQQAFEMLDAVCRGPVSFWIDSLCINQQDVIEKNQQVAMMADIFSKASLVIVWLGPDPYHDADPMFSTIADLVEKIARLHAVGGKIKYLQHGSADLHWALANGEHVVSALPSSVVSPGGSEAERLSRFFNLPWFSRSWVLQEVGLAASTNVIWGGRALDWNAIGLTALFLVRHSKAVLDNLQLTDAVQNVCHVYTAFSPFTLLHTFLHLLNKSRKLKSTDPRDKAFAFLSHPTASTISINEHVPKNLDAYKDYIDIVIQMLPSIQDQWMVRRAKERAAKGTAALSNEQKHVPLLKADYSKSVSEVYRDLAREHIERSVSLEILTAVQHGCDATAELPFPSWVPQWNKHNGIQTIGSVYSKHFASANRDAIVVPSAGDNLDTLIARGTIVSKVAYTSPLCHSSSFHRSIRPASDFSSSANAVADTWLKLKLFDLQASGEKYPRTVQSMTSDGHPVLGPEYDILTAYMRTWVAGKNLSEADGFDLENDINAYWHCLWVSPSEGTGDNSEDHLMRAERYRMSAAAVADQRKLFIVKKGLFGLGPGAMKKGDWVAVLLGADVPFIIREVGGEHRPATDPFPEDVKFQLVGECYVDGLMTGAAVRGVEVTRDIVLV
ncbi:MAG: hypothetical protein Q9222_004219 [Ikaeria aurantiellina]